MTPVARRAATTAPMNTTVLAAVLTGIGVLFIVLVFLLVRAKRTHKQWLADLEERGLVIARTQKDANRDVITKPRAVLRRNMILPFNSKSGWGTLSSVETIKPVESQPCLSHYVPPKPADFESKPKRLSWPFSARRASGKAMHMRKIRVPVLSTVIESPKPSPLVPVLSGSLGGEPSSPKKSGSRPSSDQSLLRRHPAFRDIEQSQEAEPEGDSLRPQPLRRSSTSESATSLAMVVRPNRSKSVAEIPVSSKAGIMSRLPRPKLHARSVSMCSQKSGNAPISDLPPLPLEVVRIKSQARKRNAPNRSPSRISISSFESAGSSILATQSSPIMRSSTSRVQKVTKREWGSSVVLGPRPLRNTLTLDGRNQSSQGSIKNSMARFSSVTPSTQHELQSGSRSFVFTNSSGRESIGRAKITESIPQCKVYSPACSPVTVRSYTTPKRKSASFVTPYGSPEERRKQTSTLQNVSGLSNAPKRQLSQASTRASSTRSSNGNPFQWDPSPMSTGKPSALKGSPSARKGHKRQNCVRISLIPTMLGPPSRSPSPSCMKDIQEESPAASEKGTSTGLGFSSRRSLPHPPSTSIFAPDLKITATSIRASLTPSSPTLSMANYDHGPIGTPVVSRTAKIRPAQAEHDAYRRSTGSIFSIPTFPSPCHWMPPTQLVATPPPTFALSRPSNEYEDDCQMSDTGPGASSPFEMLLDTRSSRDTMPLKDECDPERRGLTYQTPTSSPTKNVYSPISTIPEESSARSNCTAGYERLRSEDSPPCSPKTIPLPTLECSTISPLIKDASIPEQCLDTIDPALLSKDPFNSLNSHFDNKCGSIMKSSNSSRSSIPIPTTPGSAKSMFEPLLEAAFPSSPPVASNTSKSPAIKHRQSELQSGLERPSRSVHSSPGSVHLSPPTSPSPFPISPCSPRPRHMQLPAPSLNFADIPMLNPPRCGPRVSPPRPLRSSIQKLRRMNSDAEKGGRGEHRYLRLGREDSIALPGDESWFDELDVDEEDDNEAWDEEKGRRLVGDVLNDWEEEAAMLEIEDHATPTGKEDKKHDVRLEEPKGPLITPDSRPSTPAIDRSSSIWEDGEKFWASTPPHPPNSPNKPKQLFQPLSPSPLSTPRNARKREFEVAKDNRPAQQEDVNGGTKDVNGESGENGRRSSGAEKSSRYRKRSVLGVGTPNVRIQVQPPSSGGFGTPGSPYDADGFLIVRT